MSAAESLDALLGPHGLEVLATLAPAPEDTLPAGTQGLALTGPAGPRFWNIFRASPEAADGAPDPLDRWSRRVLDGVAEAAGGTALYPFGGPPWHPFIAWALRSGQVFTSPVTLLAHPRHGLFVSFRGALALPWPLPAAPATNPCETCVGQPCRTACPAGALTPTGYDIPACHAHLDDAQGADCLSGCLVRRACPVGSSQPPEQSAFHMAAFHRSPQ